MARIVGGIWGGRRLVTPRGTGTRPTAEKVRAAVANSLAAADALAGTSVLDLYAGTGAFGLELISRGAERVVAVERDHAALTAIRRNIRELGTDALEVAAMDVSAYARMPGAVFDIVIADPPYDVPRETLDDVFRALCDSGRLAASATLIVEVAARAGDYRWPHPLVPDRTRRYGDTMICYGRAP